MVSYRIRLIQPLSGSFRVSFFFSVSVKQDWTLELATGQIHPTHPQGGDQRMPEQTLGNF